MGYQCNGWTYDNAYLITFKVGPLHACTHTHTHTHTHLLHRSCHCWKHRQKGSFGIFCSSGIPFDVLHGCEMHPLEAHFQSREQPKVTRSEIWRLRWLGDDRNAFLGVRTKPHIACCAAVPRREKHSCHHPTTVISGSCSE